MITDNINVILDARVRNIISKGSKYRFHSNIDLLNVVERSMLLGVNEKMLNLMP